MDALREIAALIPDHAWQWATLSALGMLAVPLFPKLRTRWHKWRLQRRMDDDRPLTREEHRDLALAVGGEVEPFDVAGSLTAAIFIFIVTLISVAAPELEYGSELLVATLALPAIGWIYAYWRKLNDPPLEDGSTGESSRPDFELPREAVAGIALGGALMLGVAIYAFTLAG